MSSGHQRASIGGAGWQEKEEKECKKISQSERWTVLELFAPVNQGAQSENSERFL